MDLNDARTGDIAIFSDGSQAVIHGMSKTVSGRVYITFEKEVTGWINESKHYDWTYHKDGRFVVSEDNKHKPHIDIAKVIHNDQEDG